MTTVAGNPAPYKTFADAMGDIVSDLPKEVGRVHLASPIEFTLSRKKSVLTIPTINARPPHPPHHSAHQGKA